jgi:Starch-binding associating with outer membrane
MYNKNFKLPLILSFSAILFITSCSKIDDFGSTNTDPNGAVNPYTAGLLTNTLANIGSNLSWDQGGLSTQQGLYCQYFSETQYPEISNYSKPNNNWDAYYSGPLKDLQVIIDYNSDPATAGIAGNYGTNSNQIAIARILKAWYFWFLTDTYGDIPYKNIFDVKNSGIVAYTPQQEIYDSLFTELDGAVHEFDPTGTLVQGDILFNPGSASGQVTSWQMLANSLRAIMALRLSKVDPAKGKTEFNAALSAPGGVLETGHNVTLTYSGGSSFPNPFYNYINITKRDDYGMSDVMVNWMNNEYDDRLYVYARNVPTNLGVQGFPYGLTRTEAIDFANANTGWTRPVGSSTSLYVDGTSFINAASPVTILGASEVYLARAEAAKLGWTDESVENNYNTGIEESWKQWDMYGGTLQPAYGGSVLDGEDYEYYITQDDIALTGGADDIEKIATQEWIAHYPNGWMGWADWRRTGYPELTPSDNSTYKKIPIRVPYGQNEFSLNPGNVADASKQYSGVDGATNSMYGHIWWNK